nr:hypothetical protein BaRGS_025173 [Batillaria attramentaria]
MLVLLAVVCLAGPLAASLPDVTVSHDGGLHFKMSGDGKWLWKDLEMVLHPGDKIQYNAVAYGPHGKVESPVKDWVYEIWGECTQSANYGCHREGKNGLLPPIMSGKIFSKPTLRYGTVEFYMIFNVAVGGTNGFFPDGLWSNKPWSNNSPHAADDFYAHKNEWYSTWHGDDVAMWIDWVEFRAWRVVLDAGFLRIYIENKSNKAYQFLK